MFPSYTTLGPFPESSLSFIAVIESENPLNPYVETWTLSVERELARNTTLEVNYIGNGGIHLLNRHNIAQPLDIPAASLAFCQEQDSAGNYFNSVGATAVAPCTTASRLKYPNFNGTYIDSDFHGYSHYDAANIKFEHRAGDLAVTSVFTWAKSLDNKSATAGAGGSLTGYEGFMDNSRPNLDYGPSDFNVPYRFVASYVYNLPIGRGKKIAGGINRLADEAIGGWELTGITTLQKGFPLQRLGRRHRRHHRHRRQPRQSHPRVQPSREHLSRAVAPVLPPQHELLHPTGSRHLWKHGPQLPDPAGHQQL